MIARALILALVTALPLHAIAETISGKAQVIDGDTIRVAGAKIRLNGIDAPELGNRLGQEARKTMGQIVGNKTVACKPNGDVSYDRIVAVCFLPDGTDIGAELIRRGRALDCRRYSGGKYRKFEMPGVRNVIRQAPYC